LPDNPTNTRIDHAIFVARSVNAVSYTHLTEAIHLWADAERHKLFANPTHSLEESESLYADLNNRTEQMLSNGESVVDVYKRQA